MHPLPGLLGQCQAQHLNRLQQQQQHLLHLLLPCQLLLPLQLLLLLLL